MMTHQYSVETLWNSLQREAAEARAKEPALQPLLDTVTGAQNFKAAVGNILHARLFQRAPQDALPVMEGAALRDLLSILTHDPAAHDALAPFLFFKGFHALQAYRAAYALWGMGRTTMALHLQSLSAEIFGVDIHPAAQIGAGVMMDHATGIVIGETAIVEDDVLLWHGVTLGGKGITGGDRHPKIRRGAHIGAHATLIGNIEVGAGARIGAGSVVTRSVPAGATVVGNPAREV